MVRTGDLGRRAKSRSFRQSFLIGFASRIGHRLKESAGVATSDALREHGGQLLPVLADRSREVDELRNGTLPESEGLGLSAPDWSGWAVGLAAADVAVIARGPILENKVTA